MWLRTIAYDRAPSHKTLWTYVLSALWHGFYPGYYFTFLGGAIFTLAARSVSYFYFFLSVFSAAVKYCKMISYIVQKLILFFIITIMLCIYTFIHVKMLLILIVFNRYVAAFVLCFKSANSGPDLMMFLPA